MWKSGIGATTWAPVGANKNTMQKFTFKSKNYDYQSRSLKPPFPMFRYQDPSILNPRIRDPRSSESSEDRGYLILGFRILTPFSNIATNISKHFTWNINYQNNSTIYFWHFGGGPTPWKPHPLSDLPVDHQNRTEQPYHFNSSFQQYQDSSILNPRIKDPKSSESKVLGLSILKSYDSGSLKLNQRIKDP